MIWIDDLSTLKASEPEREPPTARFPDYGYQATSVPFVRGRVVIDYDAAIAGLLARWLQVPPGLSPQAFKAGFRRLIVLQAATAILTFGVQL